MTTKRYDPASSSEPDYQALAEELDSQQVMHSDLTPVGEAEAVTVAGLPGRSVEYTYSDENKRLRGQAIAVTTGAGLTYRIRFEAVGDAFGSHRPVFDAILQSLVFRTTS